MTDPLLANKADLEDFLQSTVADDQALLLLSACSDAVRAFTGQFLSPVAADAILLRGNDQTELTLPQWPVTAVTEVLELAPDQEVADGAVLVDETDFYVTTSGVLRRLDGGTWCIGYRFRVTYDHGWDPPKPSTVLAVCRMAGKLLANPTAAGPMQSETIGDYSYTLAAAANNALSSMTDEKALLAPLRSPAVA